MTSGLPPAFKLGCLRADTLFARHDMNLNQIPHLGPWSATLDILNSVESDVNPVFLCFEGQAVQTCSLPKGTGGMPKMSANIPKFSNR